MFKLLKKLKTTIKQTCILCDDITNNCVCSRCALNFTNCQYRCLSCAIPLHNDLTSCGSCLNRSPIFNRAYALYNYEGLIAYLIKSLKYQNKLCLANYFAYKLNLAFKNIITNGASYEAIIPMPLSNARLRQRGYNQVIELSKHIAKNNKNLINTKSCVRIKSTKPLAFLKPVDRINEIKGAFAIKHPLPYKKVLLIDDIMTTGSSLNELAKTILKNTSVRYCDVLVLARAASEY